MMYILWAVWYNKKRYKEQSTSFSFQFLVSGFRFVWQILIENIFNGI